MLLIAVLLPTVLFVLRRIVNGGAAGTILLVLGAAALAAAAAFIAIGGIIANRILYQNKGKDTHKAGLEQLKLWGFDCGAFLEEHEGIELRFTAEDGNAAPGTYFRSGGSKCAVLVHGAGGDRTSIFPVAEEYLKRGYDVIAIDQRGCGANGDRRVTFGINEAQDVEAAVEYARSCPGMRSVIVHGQSMGAQTAALYASKAIPGTGSAADAIVCDSPVPGMTSTLRSVLGGGDPDSFAAKLLTSSSKLFMLLFCGVDYDDGDTIEAVKSDLLPTLIILSEQDTICPPNEVKRVFECVACKSKALVRLNCGHIGGVTDDPEGYMECVERFLVSVGIE